MLMLRILLPFLFIGAARPVWATLHNIPSAPAYYYDTTCINSNIIWDKTDGDYPINERLGLTTVMEGAGQRLSSSKKQDLLAGCKLACQNTNKEVATCTHFNVEFEDGINIVVCKLYSGAPGRKRVKHATVDLFGIGSATKTTFYSGPVYCASETKKNLKKARVSSRWEKVVACGSGVECRYTKQVGITKGGSTTTGSSSTSGRSTSVEFGLTFGTESGGDLSPVKFSLQRSMSSSHGFSWTQQRSNSQTFTNSRTKTESLSAKFEGETGRSAKNILCQPVGHVDDFEIRANEFKRFRYYNSADGCN